MAKVENIAANLKAARESFPAFVKLLRPGWRVVPEFHAQMNGIVDRLFKGELIGPSGEPVFNLMVNMPPRHNKSETFTKLAPLWNMGNHPGHHHMTASNSKALAMDFGREVRSTVDSQMYKLIFPDFKLRHGTKSAEAFATTKNGRYFAIGMGGTSTGRPANVLIIDDPIKNRQQAESKTQMDAVWSHITSALERRLEPTVDGFPFIRIVVMTRWHPDDPCGRYMQTDDWQSGKWYHLKLPGVIDMKSKTTLWQERFPYSHFSAMIEADPQEFMAQVQQEPYIPGGSLIRNECFGYYNPGLVDKSQIVSLIIAADTAQKKDEKNDPTALAAWALMETGDIFLLDMWARRMEYPELRETLSAYAARYRGMGLHGVYIEDKSSGTSLTQDLKMNTKLPIIPWVPPYGQDKVAKVRMVSPLQLAGRVLLPAGAPWVEAFLQQCEQFPNSVHDDMVDNLAIALSVLSKQSYGLEVSVGGSESLNSIIRRAPKSVLGEDPRDRKASLASVLKNSSKLSRALGS